jgi:hypothetical protein
MDERNQNRDPAGITALLQQIKRDWAMARAWLYRQLSKQQDA